MLNYPLDVVIRLAQFYGTSTDYLLGLTDTPDPYPRRGAKRKQRAFSRSNRGNALAFGLNFSPPCGIIGPVH